MRTSMSPEKSQARARRPYRFQVYRSRKDGLWYWRLRSANGRTVAFSRQGHAERRRALAIVHHIQDAADSFELVVLK
jgi:uncharacterized protein YegP (UPF0339 family)